MHFIFVCGMLQMSESDLSNSDLSEVSDVETENSDVEAENSQTKAKKEAFIINNVVYWL